MSEKPSFVTMLKNFAKAATEHITSGLPQTSDGEKERRASICESCDDLDKEQYRCNVCGCYLVLKTAWISQQCPLGKWPKLDQDNKSNDNKNM